MSIRTEGLPTLYFTIRPAETSLLKLAGVESRYIIDCRDPQSVRRKIEGRKAARLIVSMELPDHTKSWKELYEALAPITLIYGIGIELKDLYLHAQYMPKPGEGTTPNGNTT